MSDQKARTLAALGELSVTTDVLVQGLTSSHGDRAHEAICVMLMQGMDFFGRDSVAMKQFFPVWDAIKSHIDRADLPRALQQTETWRIQLREIISISEQS